MNVALRGAWTTEAFLDWAAAQEGRHEFDGRRPVAVTGGSAAHNRVMHNVYRALTARLDGGACSVFGPDLGVRTVGGAIRYPDILVTCTPFPITDRLAPDPVAVFEVLSPESRRRDKVQKAAEYAGVPSIRLYVLLEAPDALVTVLRRSAGGSPWSEDTLALDDVLRLEALGVEMAVAELYIGVVPAAPPSGLSER